MSLALILLFSESIPRLERLQDKQKEYDWAVQQVLALRAMEEVRGFSLIALHYFYFSYLG